MQELATVAQPDGPGWLLVPAALLTRAAWRRVLGPFRLPRYRSIMWELADFRRRMHVMELWLQVFGDRPPALDSDSLTLQLVGRVNRELFRVDLSELDHYQEMIWSDYEEDEADDPPPESILDMPIPLQATASPGKLPAWTRWTTPAGPSWPCAPSTCPG